MESKDGLIEKCKDLDRKNRDLIDELHFYKVQCEAQKSIIRRFMNKYPLRAWTCKKRNTTSVEMCNGDVVIVRRKKGEKDCIHTAICYAIVKNMIGSEKLNSLAKNAAHYEPKH